MKWDAEAQLQGFLAEGNPTSNEDFLRIENLKSYLFLDALKGVANHVGDPSMYTHIAGNNYAAKKVIQKLLEWSLILEVDQRGGKANSKICT